MSQSPRQRHAAPAIAAWKSKLTASAAFQRLAAQ
jgi:hypothetical protein